MSQGHNNPPYHVLNLDQDQYEYLIKLFDKGKVEADNKMMEIGSMRSEDPRSRMRSILTMAAAIDAEMYDSLLEGMIK